MNAKNDKIVKRILFLKGGYMKKELEIILQFVCCNSGEKRFCELCPWKDTRECAESEISNDDLYRAVKKILDQS